MPADESANSENADMAENETAEAPGDITGADEQPTGNLTVDDLAASFAERVEETPESEPSESEATEDSTTEDAEAEEDQDNALSQSDDEEIDSEDSEPPKAVGKLLKQVNKLTARAKAAEEANEAMQAEIETLKSQPKNETQTEPTGQPDLDDVKDFQGLNKLRQEALAAKRWALQHVGKDYVEADGKEYDGDEIRNILTQAEDYLSEKIPVRAQFLQEKQQWDSDTAQTFPWLAEQEGELYETFVGIRRGEQYSPLLAQLPNADFVAATLARGIAAIRADQEAATKKPKAKAKPNPPTSEGDAAAPAPTEARRTKKKKAILGQGNVSVDQLAAYLAD